MHCFQCGKRLPKGALVKDGVRDRVCSELCFAEYKRRVRRCTDVAAQAQARIRSRQLLHEARKINLRTCAHCGDGLPLHTLEGIKFCSTRCQVAHHGKGQHLNVLGRPPKSALGQ